MPTNNGPFRVISAEPHCSLREVAAELGVTVERARQIEKAALTKLRLRLLARRVRKEDLLGD